MKGRRDGGVRGEGWKDGGRGSGDEGGCCRIEGSRSSTKQAGWAAVVESLNLAWRLGYFPSQPILRISLMAGFCVSDWVVLCGHAYVLFLFSRVAQGLLYYGAFFERAANPWMYSFNWVRIYSGSTLRRVMQPRCSRRTNPHDYRTARSCYLVHSHILGRAWSS